MNRVDEIRQYLADTQPKSNDGYATQDIAKLRSCCKRMISEYDHTIKKMERLEDHIILLNTILDDNIEMEAMEEQLKSKLTKYRETEQPEPLSFEELKGKADEPVWIADLEIPSCSEWRIVREYWSDGVGGEVDFEGGCESLLRDDYNKTWLAYAQKPRGHGNEL